MDFCICADFLVFFFLIFFNSLVICNFIDSWFFFSAFGDIAAVNENICLVGDGNSISCCFQLSASTVTTASEVRFFFPFHFPFPFGLRQISVLVTVLLLSWEKKLALVLLLLLDARIDWLSLSGSLVFAIKFGNRSRKLL